MNCFQILALFWDLELEKFQGSVQLLLLNAIPILDVCCEGGTPRNGNFKIFKQVFFINIVSIVWTIKEVIYIKQKAPTMSLKH